jgi:hypothetical protein
LATTRHLLHYLTAECAKRNNPILFLSRFSVLFAVLFLTAEGSLLDYQQGRNPLAGANCSLLIEGRLRPFLT